MPIQHSPPARQSSSCSHSNSKRSSRWHPRSSSTEGPLRQRKKCGRRSTIQEGSKRAKKSKFLFRSSWQFSRTFKGPGEDSEEEDSNQYI
ncbi:hypothetical protein O181_036110 [Austropuccinia psidii MF-1]|uniref:Uncharacterized protein n=1 Tax=Austropuccinia psidii MF-1 TaxID=1389203 RepID=A0A9Q3D5X8_9BASI|nr:hypothetical protein [Austropuccinia psidii MF-1]